MKTITYNIKSKDEDTTTKWYVELLNLLDDFSNTLKDAPIEDIDLIFYPIDLDLILREKYILISANKVAYKYQGKLMIELYELFRKHDLKFEMKIREKKES